MSILIKGINMPEDGGTIVLKIKGSKIYREYPRHKFQPTRIKDAEAIQIPKDHGIIVDLDKVKRKGIDDGYAFYVSWTDIDNEPTILEAEE